MLFGGRPAHAKTDPFFWKYEAQSKYTDCVSVHNLLVFYKRNSFFLNSVIDLPHVYFFLFYLVYCSHLSGADLQESFHLVLFRL